MTPFTTPAHLNLFCRGHHPAVGMSIVLNHRQTVVIVISSILAPLAITAVTLRLIARFRVTRAGSFDDCILFLGLCSVLTCIGSVCSEIFFGLGQHIQTISPEDLERFFICFWISIITYAISVAATKTSIILQYFRFLTKRGPRIACWVILFVVNTYGLFGVLVTIFMCNPVQGFWRPAIAKSCISRDALWITNSSISIVTDLVILCIPVSTILGLNIPLCRKIPIFCMFGVGIVACLVTILRMGSLVKASRDHDITCDIPAPLCCFVVLTPADINAITAVWSISEITAAIICASVPGIKPIFQRRRPRQSSTSYIRTTQDSTELSAVEHKDRSSRIRQPSEATPRSLEEEPLRNCAARPHD
ncbi:hypothetical protein BP6252_10170 [Coleophoma cylindrospora]|uniref:Rhodopsin domain-containing protein n=1 Tax=Coleophoma cylindrospora TaxID=1849047 RepID=A0A3D8QXP3_9HELO|nr:hypothetical protein BP6252_10170 [Coleophoma cylindrospora]